MLRLLCLGYYAMLLCLGYCVYVIMIRLLCLAYYD